MQPSRAVGIVLGAALVAALLAGCGPSEPRTRALTDSPLPKSTAVTALADGVPGVTRTALAAPAIAADLSYLTGAEPLNLAVDAIALQAIDGRLGSPFAATLPPTGFAVVPASDTGALTIVAEPVVAAGPWLGMRVTATVDGAPSWATVLYYDTDTGEVTPAAGLVAPERVDALVASLGPGWTADDLQSLVITADGDGVVIASGAAPRLLPAERLRPLLSAQGRAVRQVAASGDPFTPPTGGFEHVPCSLLPCVALTFDDGPSPETTGRLLDLLRDADVPATFFVEGRWAAAYPDLIRRQAAEGHAVENHTYDHPDLATLPPEAITQQIASTDAAVVADGVAAPQFIRAPYGSTGGAVTSTVDKPLVFWSVDTFDWRSKNADKVARRAIDNVVPGAIVLMHDIYPSTVDAQSAIIDTLRGRGYVFVTVPQLVSGIPLAPGQQITCRGTGGSDTGPACAGR